MKFEKFLKGVGTHGQILERANGDKWLLCESVGMKIPKGVENLLGAGKTGDLTSAITEEILRADTSDDTLTLRRAILRDPAGKAGDIIRVFETGLTVELEINTIGIYNGDYGLLEKKDKLTYLEIEDYPDSNGECKIIKVMVVLDRTTNEPIGYISGVENI